MTEKLKKTIVVPKDGLTEYSFLNAEGQRCALGWLIVARGGDTGLIARGGDEAYDMCDQLFPDVRTALGGARKARDWSARVIYANNHLYGRERETKLRALFAEAGLTLKFSRRGEQIA